jgi:hypothetical protein
MFRSIVSKARDTLTSRVRSICTEGLPNWSRAWRIASCSGRPSALS